MGRGQEINRSASCSRRKVCGSFFQDQQLYCHNPSAVSEEEDMADLSIQCIDCGAPLIPEVEESCCRCVWCDSLLLRDQEKRDDGKVAKLDLVPKVTAGEFVRPSAKAIG
jgi:hypothetical protein